MIITIMVFRRHTSLATRPLIFHTRRRLNTRRLNTRRPKARRPKTRRPKTRRPTLLLVLCRLTRGTKVIQRVLTISLRLPKVQTRKLEPNYNANCHYLF